MRMNPKVKAKWVAALRSGQYKQATGVLRDVTYDEARDDYKTRGFCCLGVLCNLHAQAFPKVAATQLDPDRYLNESGVLPLSVRQWARLPEDHGAVVSIDGHIGLLTEHNDSGATFKQIAKAIEEQL